MSTEAVPEIPHLPEFRNTCLQLLRTIDNLPALPALLWELQAVVQNPLSDAYEISAVIERDPGLAAAILRIANSAWYGASGRVMDLREGVARLGTRVVGEVATSALVLDTFAGMDTAHGATEFWKHSNRVAFICRTLSESDPERTPLMPHAAYTAGLVHDLGKLVLDHFFEAECKQMYKWKETHAVSDAEAEQTVLGVDHGEVGAELLECWSLPDEIVLGVRYHHCVENVEGFDQKTPRLIQQADAIAHAIEEGNPERLAETATLCKLAAEVFERLSDDLKREDELVDLVMQ